MSDIDLAKVLDALYRRAVGCEVESIEVVEDAKAKLRVKRTRRKIPPDTKAAIYILNNRRSDQWSAKPKPPPTLVIAKIRPMNLRKPPSAG